MVNHTILPNDGTERNAEWICIQRVKKIFKELLVSFAIRLEKLEGGASEIKVKPAKSDLQNSELEKKLAEKDSQLQR